MNAPAKSFRTLLNELGRRFAVDDLQLKRHTGGISLESSLSGYIENHSFAFSGVTI